MNEHPAVHLTLFCYWSNVHTRAAFWRSRRTGRKGRIDQSYVHLMARWNVIVE